MTVFHRLCTTPSARSTRMTRSSKLTNAMITYFVYVTLTQTVHNTLVNYPTNLDIKRKGKRTTLSFLKNPTQSFAFDFRVSFFGTTPNLSRSSPVVELTLSYHHKHGCREFLGNVPITLEVLWFLKNTFTILSLNFQQITWDFWPAVGTWITGNPFTSN